MPDLTAFVSLILITAFTPGPNNIMAMSIAGQHGQRQGMLFCAGVFLGFLAIMTVCALCSVTVHGLFPGLEPGLRMAGGVYMLWLAWSMFGSARQGSAAASVRRGGVVSGMLLQFVNPKVIAYGVTAFSSFIAPQYTAYPTLLLFALLLAGVGFAGTCCWSVCGGVLQERFARHPRSTNAILASLMGCCAVSLFL